MDTSFDELPETGDRIVYVREIAVTDLPDDVQQEINGMKTLFSVHDSSGERLALVADKEMAFDLAREHNYAPVSVH
ncbi:DUF1150 family protein [Candidatus Halocynthiibacter alkanivorans]|jgi:hypothetical protein|uniref:DUF1150 family protein n=1 Tax=Candidatus Halocynthiibacter alkanivorans TaxID=2267619 RepID=UPI000DF1CE56|nr:DUF1150 family protein [Candidatus Halocynthiibacter alkanivorans]